MIKKLVLAGLLSCLAFTGFAQKKNFTYNVNANQGLFQTYWTMGRQHGRILCKGAPSARGFRPFARHI